MESVSFYPGMARMLETIAKMDAHHRLLLGFVVAAVVGAGFADASALDGVARHL